MELKPCLCPKNGARTLRKVTSKIWQCPRCGGVGSISEPEVKVKEPQWPDEEIVDTYLPQNSTERCVFNYGHSLGYNEGRSESIKAWKDAQG